MHAKTTLLTLCRRFLPTDATFCPRARFICCNFPAIFRLKDSIHDVEINCSQLCCRFCCPGPFGLGMAHVLRYGHCLHVSAKA